MQGWLVPGRCPGRLEGSSPSRAGAAAGWLVARALFPTAQGPLGTLRPRSSCGEGSSGSQGLICCARLQLCSKQEMDSDSLIFM